MDDDEEDDNLNTVLNMLADSEIMSSLEIIVGSFPIDNYYVDSFSGLGLSDNSITLSNQFSYDALFLSDFILETKDLRIPLNKDNKLFTPSDLSHLAQKNPQNAERLFSLASEIQNNYENPTSSVSQSIVKFINSTADAASMQLLGACELTANSSLHSLQILFEQIWLIFLKCFGVLIRIHPLEASILAARLYPLYFVPEVYDPYIIKRVSASVKALCMSVFNSIVSGTESSALTDIQAVIPARLI